MPSNATLEKTKQIGQLDYDVFDGPQKARLLKRRISELSDYDGPLGLDTETGGPGKKDGLLPWRGRVRLIQVAMPGYALVVDLDGWRSKPEGFAEEKKAAPKRKVPWHLEGLRELKALLESQHAKALQNAPFDLTWLRCEGVKVGGPIFDTMIGAKIITAGTRWGSGLDDIAKRYLKITLDKTYQKFDYNTPEIPADALMYAAKDAAILTMLVGPIKDRLVESGLWHIFKLEMQILRPVAEMRWNGMGFDAVACTGLNRQLMATKIARRDAFVEALDEKLRARFPEDSTKWIPRDEDGSFNLRTKESGSVRAGTKKRKGFNIGSPLQVGEALLNCGVQLDRTDTGKPCLDKNFLSFVDIDRDKFPEHARDLILGYRDYKQAETLVGHTDTLLDAVEADGRIHADYQLLVDTGRMSCRTPNLQQVPSKPPYGPAFRSLFTAREGYALVIADFGQIELRVACHLSKEGVMQDAYLNQRDLHTETAARMIGRDPVEMKAIVDDPAHPEHKEMKAARTNSKCLNFGLLFGAGKATIRKQAVSNYGLSWTMNEAAENVRLFKAAYPTLAEWQETEGNKTTSAVFTLLGRRRMTCGMKSEYTSRINTQVQGTAGDITKVAIRDIWKDICRAPDKECFLIGVVHDEIILEVKEGTEEKWKKLLSDRMVAAGESMIDSVPIVADADSGRTWADAK